MSNAPPPDPAEDERRRCEAREQFESGTHPWGLRRANWLAKHPLAVFVWTGILVVFVGSLFRAKEEANRKHDEDAAEARRKQDAENEERRRKEEANRDLRQRLVTEVMYRIEKSDKSQMENTNQAKAVLISGRYFPPLFPEFGSRGLSSMLFQIGLLAPFEARESVKLLKADWEKFEARDAPSRSDVDDMRKKLADGLSPFVD